MTGQPTTLWRLARYENGFPFRPEDFGPSGIPVIRIRQLTDVNAARDLTDRQVPAKHMLKKGDLIFSWSGSLAVRRWDRSPGWLNQHLFKVVPATDIDQAWLHRVIESCIPQFLGMMHGAAMSHLTLDMLKQVTINVPSLGEQRRIAEFLDAEVARIDELIHVRRIQQDLVAERHTAFLVTLTSPETGQLVPLRRIMQKVVRKTRKDDTVITAYRDGEVTLRSKRREDGYTFSDTEAGYQGVEPGDLVFHALDGFAGAVGISDARGKASPVYHVCSMRSDDDPRYMSYTLRAMGMTGYLEVQAGNVRQRSVDFRTWEAFARLPMPRPLVQEQRRIADQLTESRTWSEKVSKTLAQQLALLAERRQALITAAVTGEITV